MHLRSLSATFERLSFELTPRIFDASYSIATSSMLVVSPKDLNRPALCTVH